MKAKEVVLSQMPTAMAEKQTRHDGTVYWLIREQGKAMYYSEGDTQSEAWKNARTRLMDDFNNEMRG